MKIIGHIRTDFPSKFGIPRQSGLIETLKGKIILEPEYRNPQVYKGIEQFSHIWLLWEFSEAKKEHCQPPSSPQDWAARRAWAFSPPEPPSVPTTSAFPV